MQKKFGRSDVENARIEIYNRFDGIWNQDSDRFAAYASTVNNSTKIEFIRNISAALNQNFCHGLAASICLIRH